MDVYVNQILGEGQPHDYFYSNPEVIVCVDDHVESPTSP